MTSALIAGEGGQGILFFGKLLAHGAMLAGKNVTWFPSYGAEMRGGTANCTVIISEDPIGSPVTRTPDIFVAFNKASKKRFEGWLKKGGLMVMDSSLINIPPERDDLRVLEVPATEIASSLGNAKSANMVMLGALLAEVDIFDEASAFKALEEMTPEGRIRSLEPNKTAIREGKACRDYKKSKDA